MFGFLNKKAEVPMPDASRIVPRIKHRNFLEALKPYAMKLEQSPVTVPFVADLLLTYAFDLPETFQMVCYHDLTRLGITAEKVHAIAVANVAKQLEEIPLQGEPPLLKIAMGNHLEPCVLLLDGFWKDLETKIPGEIVVGLPHRDGVLITSSASKKGGLKLLREAVNLEHAAYAEKSAHALTLELLVRSNGKWEKFREPE